MAIVAGLWIPKSSSQYGLSDSHCWLPDTATNFCGRPPLNPSMQDIRIDDLLWLYAEQFCSGNGLPVDKFLYQCSDCIKFDRLKRIDPFVKCLFLLYYKGNANNIFLLKAVAVSILETYYLKQHIHGCILGSFLALFSYGFDRKEYCQIRQNIVLSKVFSRNMLKAK